MSDLMRGSVLLKFSELVSSLGGDSEDLLHARGIDPTSAGDYDRFLSTAAAAAVVSDAAAALDCPDFGMRLARLQGIQILGPVAVLVRNAETVGAALDGVSRYLHNVAPAEHFEVVRGSHAALFTMTTTVRQGAHHDQWVEKGLALSVEGFRLMLGEDFVPLRVTVQHRRRGPIESYRAAFGCPVKFESELNSVHLPKRVLARRIIGRDAAAWALAERYLGEIGPDLEVSNHVRDLTRRLLPINQASLVETARAMSLHPRVLQRRLAQAGTSYEEILDEIRRELAWELSVTTLQISRIASTLGYAEQSSYARACRRWYGESPRQLRARRRASSMAHAGVPGAMERG